MTFIAFEGRDGVGKSTQAARLANRLGAVLTREPGGTALGERIREILLERGTEIWPRAEALLMAAARAQHLCEVIGPALEEGRVVVTDRYAHSSLAYQAYGRGLRYEQIRDLSHWASEGYWPDVVVLLDVPDEVPPERLADPDRFESEPLDFHERVVAGYRQMAAEEPDRWVVIDATGTIDEVEQRVWSAVSARISV